MPPRKRLAAKTTKPTLRLVEKVKPDPVLWRIALEAANGDRSRIEVVSKTEVLVKN